MNGSYLLPSAGVYQVLVVFVLINTTATIQAVLGNTAQMNTLIIVNYSTFGGQLTDSFFVQTSESVALSIQNVIVQLS